MQSGYNTSTPAQFALQLPGTVNDFAWAGTKLVVAGSFDHVGGSSGLQSKNFAIYDQSQQIWLDVEGGVDNTVQSVVITGNNVFAMGSFQKCGASAQSCNFVARFDLGAMKWYPMNQGLSGQPSSIFSYNG